MCFFFGGGGWTEGGETPVQTKFQGTRQLDREPSRSLVGNCMYFYSSHEW